MNTQPEALRLAAVLDAPEEHYPGNFDTPQRANAMLLCLAQEAAAELRRLHGVNAELVEALEVFNYAMRDASDWPDTTSDQIALVNAVNKARAAITKATGETK